MNTDSIMRLILVVKDASHLLAGEQVDAFKLATEARELAQEFQQATDTSSRIQYLAAIVVATFSEASIVRPHSQKWLACLNSCQQSRNSLCKLQPRDNCIMQTLWTLGNKAHELATAPARVESTKRPRGRGVKTLRNQAFAEALAGYSVQTVESEQREVRMENPAKSSLTPVDYEAILWCGEYWTNTKTK